MPTQTVTYGIHDSVSEYELWPIIHSAVNHLNEGRFVVLQTKTTIIPSGDISWLIQKILAVLEELIHHGHLRREDLARIEIK